MFLRIVPSSDCSDSDYVLGGPAPVGPSISTCSEQGALYRAAHDTADRFRNLSVALIAGSVALTLLIGIATAVSTSLEGTPFIAVSLSAMLLGSAMLWTPSGLRCVCSDLLGTVAVTTLAGFAGAVVGMLGLRLHLPLADQALRSADLMIGYDGAAVAELISLQQPWFFRLMSWGYNYTLPVIALSLVVLCFVKRVEAWRVVLCFTGTLMTSCAISSLIPAKAMALWTPREVLARLPGCSMRCFFPTFDAFYSSPDAVLALENIDGVLTFPSFHAAMGCIVLAASRLSIVTAFLAIIWFGFMMMGAVAYGGHYGVDLIGGCVVWAFWFALSKRLEEPCTRPAETFAVNRN